MTSQFGNILSYMWPLYSHDTINIGIRCGFQRQMTHVESANGVVHVHNIEL